MVNGSSSPSLGTLSLEWWTDRKEPNVWDVVRHMVAYGQVDARVWSHAYVWEPGQNVKTVRRRIDVPWDEAEYIRRWDSKSQTYHTTDKRRRGVTCEREVLWIHDYWWYNLIEGGTCGSSVFHRTCIRRPHECRVKERVL